MAIVSLTPTVASADSIAPILDTTIRADGTVQTFQGQFDLDNDVALMRFVLGEGVYDLSVSTTSWGLLDGGFDPVLSLYFTPTEDTRLSDYSLYNYLAPDGGLYPAIFDDVDFDRQLLNSSLSLTLSGVGAYILALTQTGNSPYESFSFGWDAPEFQCGDDGDCQPPVGHDLSFSVNARLTPADNTPVPEPGTLSLLGLGTLATCLRRRRTRSVTTRQ